MDRSLSMLECTNRAKNHAQLHRSMAKVNDWIMESKMSLHIQNGLMGMIHDFEHKSQQLSGY